MGIKKKVHQWIERIYFGRRYQNTIGKTALDDGMPWITFRAFDFLRTILSSKMQIFEFGMGGSTIFFSKHVHQVISVEHDEVWCKQTLQVLKEQDLHNVKYHLLEPTPIADYAQKNYKNPLDYVSFYAKKWQNYCFEDYAKSIVAYPDETFDLIFIDGRVRNSCALHSFDKLKTGGYLILDNSEREGYEYVHNALQEKKWEAKHFWGMGGYAHRKQCFWRTSFWKKIK
jgi:predicted O-methyltransferase YrrM